MSNPLSTNAPDFLLNQFLNFPTTRPGVAYFNQIDVPFTNAILQEDIFLESIPPIRDDSDLSSVSIPDMYDLSDTDISDYQVDISTQRIEKFTNLVLVPANASQARRAYTRLDACGNSLLRNAIQYNYDSFVNDQNTTINPFNYVLEYDNGGGFVTIPRLNTDYSYLFDVKSGYITFFGEDASLPDDIKDGSASLRLTFYRYNGQKGVASLNELVNAQVPRATEFIELFTKQPPVFTNNTDSLETANANGKLSVAWTKGSAYDLSYTLVDGKQLPFVDTIQVDISSSDHPNEFVPFQTLGGVDGMGTDISFLDVYYLDEYAYDESTTYALDENGSYTFRIYGKNESADVSYHYLFYPDLSFSIDTDIPSGNPMIELSNLEVVDASTTLVVVNGIPSVRAYTVEMDISISPLSSIARRSLSATEYATLTLSGEYIASQEQISTDICGGNGVMVFSLQEGDTSANLVDFRLADIYPTGLRGSLFSTESLPSLSLRAYNVKGETVQDISFSRSSGGGGGSAPTTWWMDVSSIVLDASGQLTSTVVPFASGTYDISINTLTVDRGNGDIDISVVDISMWERERAVASPLTHEGQLLFIEGRYCGYSYVSSSIAGGSVYRDWSDVSNASAGGSLDYTFDSSGVPDVIRARGILTGSETKYKWMARRFDNVKTDTVGRFRTIRINSLLRSAWPNSWRVYVLQLVYHGTEVDTTGTGVIETYDDRTSWMDARRFLSSRLAESPYVSTAVDGYGCAYGPSQIALQYNPFGSMVSAVFVLVGIASDADPAESFLTSVELS